METKKCSGCQNVLEISQFGTNKARPDGCNNYCLLCAKEKRKQQYHANLAKSQQRSRNKYYSHREEYLAKAKLRHNTDAHRKKCREKYADNVQKERERSRSSYQANRDKVLKRTAAYKKRRMAVDPGARVTNTLRARVGNALRGKIKSSTTFDLLGCSLENFKKYIESLWQSGMSWVNYGRHGWHLDHKTPVAMFDLTDAEQQKKCFHFSNFQPLWAFDNLSKGAKHGEVEKEMDVP